MIALPIDRECLQAIEERIPMGRKRKRPQRSAKPRQATNRSTQSHQINLTVSPEQLIKNGDIPKAIDALRAQLISEPTDERKRLLGDCYFQTGDYKEAANTWLTLRDPRKLHCPEGDGLQLTPSASCSGLQSEKFKSPLFPTRPRETRGRSGAPPFMRW